MRAMVVMVLVLVVARASAMCPFCPPTTPSLSEQVSTVDMALLCAWKSNRSITEDEAETQFAVVDVLKGNPQPMRGTTTKVPFLVQGELDQLFLLMGLQTPEGPEWQPLQEINDVTYGYLRTAPSPETATSKRLAYFVDYLEHPETAIASDAFAEFSRAPFEVVTEVVAKFSREKLRTWLLSTDDTMKLRKGFYGMVLGLCGTPEDVELLETIALGDPPPNEARVEVDGVMGGYLLATGAAGLHKLVEAKLERATPDAGELLAIISAVRFMWDFGGGRIDQDLLKGTLRKMLDQPAVAEVVLPDLARWKDWSVLDVLVERYGTPPFESGLAKGKVVKFLEAARKDVEADGKPSAAAKEATRLLEALKVRDPEQFRERPRSVFGR